MMNLRGFLMCFVVQCVAIQPTKQELPGLFSNEICSSNKSDIVKPWCHCKDKLKLGDDIDSWCSLYESFSQCVESSLLDDSKIPTLDLTCLHENSTLCEGFLNLVFDKKLMDKRMKYLCSDRDFSGVTKCAETVSLCQKSFSQLLSEGKQWDTEKACLITETLATCIWTNGSCLAKHRHLLARLSDSYTTSKCTKYFKITVGDRCANLRRRLYPNKKHMDTCLKGVQVLVSCLNREMMDSEHIEDIFYNIDADRTNVYIYETFRCENIQLHGKMDCFHNSTAKDRDCYLRYKQGQENFKSSIYEGSVDFPTEDICSFFNTTAECFKEANPTCHPRANNLVALICTAFPKPCQCPLGLSKEYADRIQHSTSYSSLPNISLLLCSFVLCTNFVSLKLK